MSRHREQFLQKHGYPDLIPEFNVEKISFYAMFW